MEKGNAEGWETAPSTAPRHDVAWDECNYIVT